VVFVFERGGGVNKAYRIKKSTEIDALLKQKNRIANGYFSLFYWVNPAMDHYRFALSVPKKLGNAVERNRIKRQIREIVRLSAITEAVDVFLIVRTRANELNYAQLREQLMILFARAKIIKG
jgi:ribonuclease P protein component